MDPSSFFVIHSSGSFWKYSDTPMLLSPLLSSLRLECHGSSSFTAGRNALTESITASMFHAMSSYRTCSASTEGSDRMSTQYFKLPA